jgi:dipeptidyl aminopeptidase/acylaminoacyl peptidase
VLGAEIVRRQVALGHVAVSADGETVVFGARTVRDGADVVRLHAVPWRGGRVRALTPDGQRATLPRFGADGRLAFVSDRDGVPQAYVLDLGGGEAERVPGPDGPVVDLAWTADGGALVLAVAEPDPAVRVGTGDEPVARVFRRVFHRLDGAGYLDHCVHLHLAAPGRRPRRLTSGDLVASHPCPLPDGRVAFLADRRPDRDLIPAPSVWLVDARGGDAVELARPPGPAEGLALDADGALVCTCNDSPAPTLDDPLRVYGVGLDGTVEALGDPEERLAEAIPMTDLLDLSVAGVALGTLTCVTERGGLVPCRVQPSGPAERLVDDVEPPVTLALAEGAGHVAATMCRGTEPAEVFALAPGREPRRLTRLGGAWLRGRSDETLQLEVTGPAGPIEVFVDGPRGARGPLPTILDVHGGPALAWHPTPPLESLLLVARGFRVVRPNVRGSTGYGRAHVRGLLGSWGPPVAADCHAVLDHLVAFGLVDGERLGCLGLSFGGYTVNWLLGTTDRFRAGVSENGLANLVAASGTSDVGFWFDDGERLGHPASPEGVARLWAESPLARIAEVRTPLLLLQADDDWRCPASEAEQVFAALRRLGREAELVRYPGESHLFALCGRPDRREDRHRRVLDWFERHLG